MAHYECTPRSENIDYRLWQHRLLIGKITQIHRGAESVFAEIDNRQRSVV